MEHKELVRFLLVEDNDDHAELVIQTFEQNRMRNVIEHVTDGEAALAYLDAAGHPGGKHLPDVILLDIKLPGINGLEVLEKIKTDPRLKKIPVVILTTSAEESDRARAYEHYANSYLTKPLDFGQFQRLVNDLKLYWGIWNEPAIPD